MNTAKQGRLGEELAAQHYAANGYCILEKNYRTRFGEVDIIAQNSTYLVFIEVKTRSKNSIAQPKEWVDARKQKKLILAAQDYIAKKQMDSYMRFDVVEVVLEKQAQPALYCIENAFCL